ncbi:MAG: sulfotransferase [Thermoguttaceae bacterium]|nr:sulfotransferase [Thermoguttaceae bacterium]
MTSTKDQPKSITSGVTKSVGGGCKDRFWNPRFWDGMTLGAWTRVMVAGRWRIHPIRFMMCVLIYGFGFLNSSLAAWQKLRKGKALRETKLVGEPIFIIGHWRSGTTLLHEYMMRDDRFTCADTYDCFAPSHFLVSGPYFRPWVKYLLPKKRPMDNMAAGLERPQEDEFAICALGLPSPYRNIVFPNNPPIDADYLTLRDLTDAQRAKWLDALEYILKALTIAEPKTVVLKSPPHTARVKTILERFPNAKFVHISRNPFILFPSTVNLWTTLARTHGLQRPKGGAALEEKVLSDFERMYDAYFEDVKLLKERQFCEISYDELVSAPVATLERVYAELGIEGFDEKRDEFQKFAETQKAYKKNKFEISPEIRETIARRWAKYIERYGAE